MTSITILTKVCTKCSKECPATLEYFYADKQVKNGLRSECKHCSNKAVFQWKKCNPERSKIINRRSIVKWRKTIRGHLWSIFDSMLQRCNSCNHPGYKNYGKRGIKVIFKSHEEFINYVINKLQIDPRGLEIHRIDNNGHYELGNIEFITPIEHRRSK